MQLVLFGAGIIALIATWHFVWRRTLLDTIRDDLFDLRDGTLREHFIRNGLSLDHPVYKALRDLLNGHLRHTESLSVYQIFYTLWWARQHRNVMEAVGENIEQRFRTDDPELATLVNQVRSESTRIMVSYAVLSSFVMTLFVFIPVAIVMIILSLLVHIVKGMRRSAPDRFRDRLFGGQTMRTTMEEYALG